MWHVHYIHLLECKIKFLSAKLDLNVLWCLWPGWSQQLPSKSTRCFLSEHGSAHLGEAGKSRCWPNFVFLSSGACVKKGSWPPRIEKELTCIWITGDYGNSNFIIRVLVETCLGKFFETDLWAKVTPGGRRGCVQSSSFGKFSQVFNGKQNSKLKMTNLMEAGKYDIQLQIWQKLTLIRQFS